jgi:hypothetical protein
MEVRQAIYTFADQTKNLLELLHSSAGNTVSRNDLDILEVQLYLLGKEVAKRKEGLDGNERSAMQKERETNP